MCVCVCVYALMFIILLNAPQFLKFNSFPWVFFEISITPFVSWILFVALKLFLFFFFEFWGCPLHFGILLSAVDLCSIVFYIFHYAPRFYIWCFLSFSSASFSLLLVCPCLLSLSLCIFLVSLSSFLSVLSPSWLSQFLRSVLLSLFFSPSSMDSSSSSWFMCLLLFLIFVCCCIFSLSVQ